MGLIALTSLTAVYPALPMGLAVDQKQVSNICMLSNMFGGNHSNLAL